MLGMVSCALVRVRDSGARRIDWPGKGLGRTRIRRCGELETTQTAQGENGSYTPPSGAASSQRDSSAEPPSPNRTVWMGASAHVDAHPREGRSVSGLQVDSGPRRRAKVVDALLGEGDRLRVNRSPRRIPWRKRSHREATRWFPETVTSPNLNLSPEIHLEDDVRRALFRRHFRRDPGPWLSRTHARAAARAARPSLSHRGPRRSHPRMDGERVVHVAQLVVRHGLRARELHLVDDSAPAFVDLHQKGHPALVVAQLLHVLDLGLVEPLLLYQRSMRLMSMANRSAS